MSHRVANDLKSFGTRWPHLPVLLAGLGYTLGFAPVSLWPLAMLCIAYFVQRFMRVDNLKQAFVLCWLFGFMHHITGIYWIPRAFYMDFGDWFVALGLGIPAVLLVAAYLSLFMSFPLLLAWKIRDRPWLFIISFPLLWVSGEWLRSLGIFGFPWNLSGYLWASDSTFYLMQLAAIGKVWLLSFGVVLVSTILAVKGVKWATFLLLVFVICGWSLLYDHQKGDAGTSLKVALIQPNVSQQEKWKPELKARNIQNLLKQTFFEQTKDVDIIVWPETALPLFLEREDGMVNFLKRSLREGQVLLAGTPRFVEGEGYYNSLYVVTHDGIVGRYDKIKLVPFGEYVPFRKWLPSFVDKLVESRGDYISGVVQPNLAVGNVKILPLICFEAVFPSFVEDAIDGQSVLVAVTNDGWFDGTSAPYQHLVNARVRAVESRTPLIRVANTGVSAIINKWGKIEKRIDFGHSGVLIGDISLQP